MSQISALTTLACLLAFGSILATKTRARISMMFIAAVTLTILLAYCGLPRTILVDTGLVPVGTNFIAILLVHMGSMLDARNLKSEWKTVVIALVCMCAGSIGILAIASHVYGWDYAVAATGPVSGGIVAGLIMTEAADAKGLTDIGVFVTLLLITQSLFGIPTASNCLIAEAKKLKARFAAGERLPSDTAADGAPSVPHKRLIPPMPASWGSTYVYIAKAFIVAWLALKAAPLTNGIVHPLVMALIFGIIAHEIGFIETEILSKGSAYGFILFGIMIPIYGNLVKATPKMIFDLLVPIVTTFAAALIGIAIFAFILSKIFKYSWPMCMAIGATCLFGFPGTLIVSNEVATICSDTPEERDFILGNILPKMLIAGFTTVTIASVFLAGFLVKLL